MRVCTWADPTLSGAMRRVDRALADNLPAGHTATNIADQADLVVVHTIGTDVWPVIDRIRERGQRYAIMQYCIRSTQEPDSRKWLDIWRGAEAVWSYYDLDALLVEDGYAEQECPWCGEELPHIGQGTGATDFPRCFFYAPLGADPDVFWPAITTGERYGILSSGYVAESECIAECFEANRRADRRGFHLGPEDSFLAISGPQMDFGLGITDDALRLAYSRSDYVAGLRRCEGFEMPAAEGLLCGARPIMLDAPHYRAWFGEWAEYIPEADPETVTAAITEILQGEYRPVTDAEMAAAAERFNWKALAAKFWSRALGDAA